MSPPTVGRRIRSLEERLNLRLFAHGRGDLQLTSAGRAIIGVAEEMERKSFDLGRAITRQAFVQEPPVRITCIGSVALFLTRHFEEFYAATGQTDAEILSTGQRLSLARNEADIALRMGRIPNRGNLFSRRIGRIAYAPYASLGFSSRPRHRDAGGSAPIALHRLQEESAAGIAVELALRVRPSRPLSAAGQ